MVKGPERFNVSQAARYLELDRQTVLRWRKRGLLADRATWTACELDQAAATKPPKTQPKKKTTASSTPTEAQAITSPASAPSSPTAPEPKAEGPSKPREPGAASGTTHTPERDPLELNLPMPAKGNKPAKGGDAGRTLPPPVADANPAPNAPASPPAPTPPPGLPVAETFFGSMRRRS